MQDITIKPQIPTRPKLILLVGLPGSGKTFFATKFSEEYNIPFLNFNYLRHTFFDEPKFTRTENNLIFPFVESIVKEFLKTNKSLVLEADLFAKTSRMRFSALARKYNYDVMVVWVQNSIEESKRRATKFNKKNPKDFLLTEDVFESIARYFTPPSPRENPAVISGKHAFSTQYRTVLRKLSTTATNPPKNTLIKSFSKYRNRFIK